MVSQTDRKMDTKLNSPVSGLEHQKKNIVRVTLLINNRLGRNVSGGNGTVDSRLVEVKRVERQSFFVR